MHCFPLIWLPKSQRWPIPMGFPYPLAISHSLWKLPFILDFARKKLGFPIVLWLFTRGYVHCRPIYRYKIRGFHIKWFIIICLTHMTCIDLSHAFARGFSRIHRQATIISLVSTRPLFSTPQKDEETTRSSHCDDGNATWQAFTELSHRLHVWYIYLHDWVTLFGPILVNMPALWIIWGKIHHVGKSHDISTGPWLQ